MNNVLRSKALLVLSASLAPPMANAISETQAIDVCAQSLAEKIELAQGAPLTYRIGDGSLQSSRRVRETMFYTLLVTNPKSDETVYQADCVVSWTGRVRLLTTMPLLAKNPN